MPLGHGQNSHGSVGKGLFNADWRPLLGRADLAEAAQENFNARARLAQSAERKAFNLVVVGSSPTVGELCFHAGRGFKPRGGVDGLCCERMGHFDIHR